MVDFWTFEGRFGGKVHENQRVRAKVHFGLLVRWSGQARKRPPRYYDGVVFAFPNSWGNEMRSELPFVCFATPVAPLGKPGYDLPFMNWLAFDMLS